MNHLHKKLRLLWLNLQLRWVIFRFNRQIVRVYYYPTEDALRWITQMRWYACQKEQSVIANAVLESLQSLETAVKRKALLLK